MRPYEVADVAWSPFGWSYLCNLLRPGLGAPYVAREGLLLRLGGRAELKMAYVGDIVEPVRGGASEYQSGANVQLLRPSGARHCDQEGAAVTVPAKSTVEPCHAHLGS